MTSEAWTTILLPVAVRAANGSALAPDGSAVVFSCSVPGVTDNKLCVAQLDGSGFVQLTTGRGIDTEPAWSPDGASIAFATTRFGATEVVVMNADGSDLRRLTPVAVGRSPSWSRDGTKLLYSATTSPNGGLTVVNPDGSGSVRLTTRVDDLQASWRP